MNQSEVNWFNSTIPASLFSILDHLPNRRKVRTSRRIRLFGCGCYTLIWDQIKLSSIKEVVIKTEEFADGKIGREELMDSEDDPPVNSPDSFLQFSLRSLTTDRMAPNHVAWLTRAAIDQQLLHNNHKSDSCPSQANLVREIFGNPFHSIPLNTSWLTSTVLILAQQMYDSRDFSAMPILADALQDAGCESADILDHCRGPGPHVRGCWVVDKLLSKE